MAAKQGKLHSENFRMVLVLHAVNCQGELFRRQGWDRPIRAFTDLFLIERLCGYKAKDCSSQFVVHHRVELVALQPTTGVTPDFADDISVWLNGAAPSAQLPPELIVIDFCRGV